jgi:hypothetical protein
MTVPKCYRRVVRDSAGSKYNETGLTSRAMGKIWTASRKRETRLAKRARMRNTPQRAPSRLSTEQRDQQRGYKLVDQSVEWVSNEGGLGKNTSQGFINPVTGEARWGPRVSEDCSIGLRTIMPMARPFTATTKRWESIAVHAKITPVTDQVMRNSSE